MKPDLRRCLTVHQPFADLIARGLKDVENRSWAVTYRGPLYIHASLKPDRDAYDKHAPEIQLPEFHAMKRGGIVGVATLVDIVRDSTSPWAIPGCYHWVLEKAEPLDFEPMSGAQGIWIAGTRKRVLQCPHGYRVTIRPHTAPLGYMARLHRAGELLGEFWDTSRDIAKADAIKHALALVALPKMPSEKELTRCCNAPEHHPHD